MSRFIRIALLAFGTFATVLCFTLLAALAYRAWRQHENREAMTIPAPPGIEETGFVRINGIDQWISIRGRDRESPVILLLHGGPGLAMSPLQMWFLPWERDFTVVQWDQRGAGLTYGRYSAATPNLTQEQIVRDGLTIAEYLCKRLHKRRIVLLGHSWGSLIGLQMIHRRPDLFSAYVGTGQVVDMPLQEVFTYRRLLATARAAHDARTVAALTKLGWPPYKREDAVLEEQQLSAAYPVASERDYLFKSIPAALFAPEISLKDIVDNVRGALYSGEKLYSSTVGFKATRLGRRFETPIFFFQGDQDNNTPTDLVDGYLKSIDAPSKQLVHFRGGGHLTLLTMPDAFLSQLDARVRPVAFAMESTRR